MILFTALGALLAGALGRTAPPPVAAVDGPRIVAHPRPESVPARPPGGPPAAIPRRAPAWPAVAPAAGPDPEVTATCRRIAGKLGSVSLDDCLGSGLGDTGGRSVLGAPILARGFPPRPDRPARGRVLLVGGIHGDEFSSVSIVFRWLATLDRFHSGLFHWQVVPLLNPDGLLRDPSRRMNQNGVDLNRNFPTTDWSRESRDYWERRTSRNPRRYPGPSASSEPETRWLTAEIGRFAPDVIVAVHAPYRVLDFDGPPDPPQRLGPLTLELLGTYPGSLGRYAGVNRGIPVVTIELPSAGIMPTPEEQRMIWRDLVAWLKRRLPATGDRIAGRDPEPSSALVAGSGN